MHRGLPAGLEGGPGAKAMLQMRGRGSRIPPAAFGGPRPRTTERRPSPAYAPLSRSLSPLRGERVAKGRARGLSHQCPLGRASVQGWVLRQSLERVLTKFRNSKRVKLSGRSQRRQFLRGPGHCLCTLPSVRKTLLWMGQTASTCWGSVSVSHHRLHITAPGRHTG
jgi:hypothetical protein